MRVKLRSQGAPKPLQGFKPGWTELPQMVEHSEAAVASAGGRMGLFGSFSACVVGDGVSIWSGGLWAFDFVRPARHQGLRDGG